MTSPGLQPGAEHSPADHGRSVEAQPRSVSQPDVFSPTTERSTRRGWRKEPPAEVPLGRVLSALAPDWQILRTFDVFGDLDADFVVIGPPGVFSISARLGANKKIWVDEDVIWINGRPTDHVGATRVAAARASARLSSAANEDVRVTPIIALIDPVSVSFGGDSANRLVVLASEVVPEWLSERPRAYSDEAIAFLTLTAEERSTWGAHSSTLGRIARLR